MSPGLLEIVARARDTLTERQPLTVPEEAVRQQLRELFKKLRREKLRPKQRLQWPIFSAEFLPKF